MSKRLYLVIKRLFDILVSILLVVILSPIFLACSILVLFSVGRPILLRQVRPGKDSKPFRMFKFRTMTNARDADGALLPDIERITKIGRFLRAASLDELPELLNVIRGEMSLVGPRPLLMRYLERYSAEQARRHEVRPGITGLAQINGRNFLNWEERFRLDVWYVDNLNLLLDLKILFLTIWKVFTREGMDAGGGSERPEFWGQSGRPQDAPICYPVEEEGK